MIVELMKKLLLILAIVFAFACEENEAQMISNNQLMQQNVNILEVNNALRLATSQTSTMMQEGNTASDTPNTPVTADGQTVGLMYDMGVNGISSRANTSGARPILGSGGGRNSYLTFDGSNDRSTVNNTNTLLKPLHAPSPIGTILVWVNFTGGNAQTRVIMHTDNVGNTNIGFYLIKNTSNKIVFGGTDGAAFYTCTSTNSITSATGWIGVIASVNGTGATAARLILLNADGTTLEDNTFNVPTSRGSTANATDGLWIGARSSLVANQFMFGHLSDIIIKPVGVTTDIINAYRTYNPVRTAAEFPVRLHSLYDANDVTTLFSDAAGTVQAVNNDPIRVWKNKKVSNYGPLNRDLTSASSGVSPLWRSAQINSLGALEFDGTDDNFDFPSNLIDELGGKYTMIVVVQNQNTSRGSHILQNESYLVLTGSAYSGGGNHPHWAFHGAGGDVSAIDAANVGSDLPELVVFRRNGTLWDMWNTDKTKVSATVNTTAQHIMLDMGQENHAIGGTWWFDGYMIYLAKYSGLMTDQEIESQIDQLKAKYNLP